MGWAIRRRNGGIDGNEALLDDSTLFDGTWVEVRPFERGCCTCSSRYGTDPACPAHTTVSEGERLREELRIARFDADVPIRELREENARLKTENARLHVAFTKQREDLDAKRKMKGA